MQPRPAYVGAVFGGWGRLLVGFIHSLCEGPWERHIGQEGCGTSFVPHQGDRQCPGLMPGSNLIDALLLLTKSGFYWIGQLVYFVTPDRLLRSILVS